MRICVVGDMQDLTLVYLRHCAQRRGMELIDLPEEGLGDTWTYTFDDSVPSEGRLLTANGSYSFESIVGVFVRFHSEPKLPPGLEHLPVERKTLLIGERRSALQYLLNCFPRPVVNRPMAGRSNGSKPFQMRQLAHAGFAVPRWVVSNQIDIVGAFANTCTKGAVYKSCSGLRSKVRFLDDKVLERLREGTAPIVVQEYIPGYDVRLHMVDNKAFATKITADSIDYRFSNTGGQYEAITAPDHIQTLCRRVAVQEKLTISGFDFRVTDQEVWYCLEVNPVPTFLPYEMTTGQPIAGAILDLFVGAHCEGYT